MKKINRKLYVLLFCTICVLFFVTGAASPGKDMRHYFSNAQLSDKPVIEYCGVSVTPLKWGMEDVIEKGIWDSYSYPEVYIEFLVQNNSSESVKVDVINSYINGQWISNSISGGRNDAIPPGGSGTFTTFIDERELVSQRIETIRDYDVVYNFYFKESKFRFKTDCIPILKNSQINEGLYPFRGKEIYRDEALEISASYEIKEFPGAFTTPLHIKNLSSMHELYFDCYVIEINGKPVSDVNDKRGNGYVYSLHPLRTIDRNNIIFEKHRIDNMQIPIDEITDVTVEIPYMWYQKTDTTDKSSQAIIKEPLIIKLNFDTESLNFGPES